MISFYSTGEGFVAYVEAPLALALILDETNAKAAISGSLSTELMSSCVQEALPTKPPMPNQYGIETP